MPDKNTDGSIIPPFHIVLVQPEIPPNTGNIGRLCVATGSQLHLIDPLGFDITDPQLKRAGLDYWQYLSLVRHQNLSAYLKDKPRDTPTVFLSKKAKRSLFDYSFKPGTHLIFGNETSGLPEELLMKNESDCLRIPMADERVRSLNLATAAGIVLYEAIRQVDSSRGWGQAG